MGFFGRGKKQELVGETLAEIEKAQGLQQQALAQVQALSGGIDVQALAAQAMSGAGLAEQMAYRDRIAKLMQHGVDGRATVRAVREGASSPLTGTEVEIDVTVTPAAGAPYESTVKQYSPAGAAERFAVGSEIPVRSDPDDPQTIMVWGSAQPAAAPAPVAAPSRIERLEQLGALRKSGALSEEEFEQQKAAILAEPQSLSR
jgi:Short C-terminal domain